MPKHRYNVKDMANQEKALRIRVSKRHAHNKMARASRKVNRA